MRPHHLARLVLVAAAALSAATGWSQETSRPKDKCASGPFRQFDFWIGDWEVYLPDGSRAGENRILAVAGGCALFESWNGSKGGTGNSLNYFADSDGKWHQLWIDGTAGRLDLAGGLQAESMVLSASRPHPKKAAVTVTQRITWTPNQDGSVRQHWESSEDGGASWKTLFDGRYVRKKAVSSNP